VYRPVETIEVRAWNQMVGAVALDPRLEFYAFEYAPAFVKTGIELAPLAMPLRDARQPFIFPNLPDLTYKRLPAMVADALPDDFGNSLIDAWMAREGVPVDNITALDRLAYMGQRSLGALEFRPTRGPRVRRPTALELSQLASRTRRNRRRPSCRSGAKADSVGRYFRRRRPGKSSHCLESAHERNPCRTI
jgi:serine/threonine-protein kinase HipA